MRVHANSGGHREKARGTALPVEILILDAAERNTAHRAVDRGARGFTGPERQAEVMGERIRRAERKNGKRDRAFRPSS